MGEYVVALKPVYMESSGEYLGRAVLRKFQKELADVDEGAIVLSAPTGSGKTVTLLTDSERGVSIGLYPNNELLCSQVAGLHNFIVEYLGMRPEQTPLLDYCKATEEAEVDQIPLNMYTSDKLIDMFGRRVSKIYVAGMSGRVVKTVGDRGKLDVLAEVSSRLASIHENEYAIVLCTSDTFFLLALYLYGNFENIGKLLSVLITTLRTASSNVSSDYLNRVLMRHEFFRRELEKIVQVFLPFRRSTLFVDEYHLYGFYELSSFKALAHILRYAHDWEGRLIFSSATPRRVFVEEVSEELGLKSKLKELNAIDQVKECGDYAELVRGPLKLVFVEVETGAGSYIGRLYASSELAYELLNTEEFAEFMKLYKNGVGRGMVILEKVSHAELFAEEIYSKYGIKPICLYSMPRENVCIESITYNSHGNLFIVGTGAKIGQGIEYPGVTFGLVARVTAPDFLQSISRIGRRYPGEGLVLIPMDAKALNKALKSKSTVLKDNVSYGELAKWVEEIGEPYMKGLPSGYEAVYREIIKAREELLKTAGLALYYRISEAPSESMRELSSSTLKSIEVLSPPEALYTLLMFRSTGPSVTYCRDVGGELKCYEKSEDLGTIIRNYEVRAEKGKLTIKAAGRGGVVVRCRKDVALRNFIDSLSDKALVIEWSVLRDWFKCMCKDENGDRVDELEKELVDQLFLVRNTRSEDFAEYVCRSGRGLAIKVENTSIPLLYL